ASLVVFPDILSFISLYNSFLAILSGTLFLFWFLISSTFCSNFLPYSYHFLICFLFILSIPLNIFTSLFISSCLELSFSISSFFFFFCLFLLISSFIFLEFLS